MAEQSTTPATQAGGMRALVWAVPAYLIAALVYRVAVPAHEYPMRPEQVLQIALDLGVLVGLIALRAKLPAALFWLALAAGVGLFLIRLNGDASWWTGHLLYSLPPR
jgi:hypothetical protein